MSCCRNFYKWHKLSFVSHFIDEGMEILKTHQIWLRHDDDRDWIELITINYCPWCGQKIEVDEQAIEEK